MPVTLDKALAARKDELHDVKIRGGLALHPLAIVEADPLGETFTYCSWHLSGYERKLHDAGLCHYISMVYRNKPLYYRRDLEVDVAMLVVRPMDKRREAITNRCQFPEKAEYPLLHRAFQGCQKRTVSKISG